MNDLISRQALLKELPHALWGKEWDEALAKAIIESAPTVETVKQGRWEKLYYRNYKCSCCGAWWTLDRDSTIKDFKYCPNCGARVDYGTE